MEILNDWRTADRPPGGAQDSQAKDELFLHHSASHNRAYTRRQERAAMRALYDLHVHGNGWDDIAYSYVMFPSSRIYRGRGRTIVPAAQKGHNAGTLACCVMGTNPILSLFQRRKLRKLIVALKGQGISKLGGHLDVVATACPGERIYGWVVKWRREFQLGRPR